MDTSKEYIKMCEKAEELNNIPSGTDGNWYYYKGEDIVKCRNSYEGEFGDIWLPRQDQLQEMIDTIAKEDTEAYKKDENLIVPMFWGWFCKYANSKVAGSMEQLWLAFVMKEKYNKIWNGEDWIKE